MSQDSKSASRTPGATALLNGQRNRQGAGSLEYTMREAEEAEKSVLGALMTLGDKWPEIDRIMSLLPGGAETFWGSRNPRVYEILQQLRRDEVSLEPISVMSRMTPEDFRVTDKGLYLHECLQACTNPAQGGYYAREVANAWVLRGAQAHALRTLQTAQSVPLNDAADTVRRAVDLAGRLPTGPAATGIEMWDELKAEVVRAAEEAEEAAKQGIEPGVSTGWPELDALTGGLAPGRVTVLAGRPGMGKSVAGLNIGQHLAMRLGLPVLWFTLEMTSLECAQRMMCAGARIYWDRMRDGRMDDGDWSRGARYMKDTDGAPIGFDDTPGMTTSHMESAIETFVRAHVPEGQKLGLIGVDHLGLVQATPSQQRATRQEFVDMLTQSFKNWAKRWNTHVLALAQLNRGPEQRQDKRPQLSDLRESGGIEQNADNVLFVHRDDYYDPKSPRVGYADFILAKQRGGATGSFELSAQLHMARFVSMV